MTETIEIVEAQQQLSRLLDLVKAGHDVILADGSIPVARLTAVTPSGTRPRVAGLHAGAITAGEDFDQPLPDEFWDGRVMRILQYPVNLLG